MSLLNCTTKTSITIAKLDDGRLVSYDGCMREEVGNSIYSFYDPKKWGFIGTGVCHTCNGFPSRSEIRYHFIRRNFNIN